MIKHEMLRMNTHLRNTGLRNNGSSKVLADEPVDDDCFQGETCLVDQSKRSPRALALCADPSP